MTDDYPAFIRRVDRAEAWERRRENLACMGLGALSAAAFIGVFFWMTDAHAHDAIPTAAQPLGWTYGYECCSSHDCSQVRNEEIKETPEGYQVATTGEIIPYSDKRIKRSRDEFFHRCVPGGNVNAARSLCLYVPDRGF